MRYIKTYEKIISSGTSTYKAGDHVLVKGGYSLSLKNDFVAIIKRVCGYSKIEGFTYEIDALEPDVETNTYWGFSDKDIIKKLEPFEVQALKYNL